MAFLIKMPRLCEYETNDVRCAKHSSYNFPGLKTRLRCKQHAENGMIIVKIDNRICIHEDHTDKAPRASFNFPDQNRPIYCKKHAEEGMINTNNKNNMCQSCKQKQPSYGLVGKKATHCSKCSSDEMVDLVSSLCTQEGCYKNCTYGVLGQKPTRCKTHATEEMIDVKNAKCKFCSKQPTYGITKPTHCLEHKTEEMKDLKHSTMTCKDCDKRATYGTDRPTHCVKHKSSSMVDVASRLCIKCNITQCVFGDTYRKWDYCVNCKESDMKNTKAKMCEGCISRQPVFNYKGVKPARFCAGCALDGMEDVINQKCKSCNLFIVNKKPHLCEYCKPSSSLRQKTKEMMVVNYLEEEGYKFIHNKSVGFVCGNYRPDIKIDIGTHFVIVEIDEGQHSQHNEHCEVVRMYNIMQAEGLKCVFLRYNPDVFRKDKRALKVHNMTRLKTLVHTIDKYMKEPPDEDMTVFRLFYNNPEGEYVQQYDITSKYKELVSVSESSVMKA
jgi:hypothetical protein